MNAIIQDRLISVMAAAAAGDTGKQVCPKCSGGSTGEKSFKITNVGGRAFGRCYRASCQYKTWGGGMGSTHVSQRVRHYTGATRILSTFDYAMFADKYLLTDKEIRDAGLCTDIDTGRIVFNIRSNAGEIVGHQLRSYDGQTPKTLTYGYPSPHFPVALRGETVVLCEDILSSIRIARYVPAVALLGTRVSDDLIALLIQNGIKNVYIALDKDARRHANMLSMRYGIFFKVLQVLKVERDVKDCSEQEVINLLRGAI